jgi:dTMP kinase
MKPIFVVVEGPDGSGTTTCSKLLAEKLNIAGVNSVWTKEPSDGPIGKYIREILSGDAKADELALFPMFLADRYDHIFNFIRPNLEKGISVISDRYVHSTLVYQQDSYDLFTIKRMHVYCLQPDLVFVLKCSIEECMRRIRGREKYIPERYEKAYKQEVYHSRYADISSFENERITFLENDKQTAEDTVRQMWKEICFQFPHLALFC